MWGIAVAVNKRETRGSGYVQSHGEVSAPRRKEGSAARRAFARYSDLCPADTSRAAFDDWLVRTGQSLTPDEANDCYRDMCDLMGTASIAAPAARESRVDEYPTPAPPSGVTTIGVLPGRQELDARRAAEAFLSWVRIAGRTGTYTSAEFEALYQEHCAADDLVPLSAKVLRGELLTGRHEGVSRALANQQLRGGRGGRRHRPTQWTIDPLPGVSDEIPWSDLPERIAA